MIARGRVLAFADSAAVIWDQGRVVHVPIVGAPTIELCVGDLVVVRDGIAEVVHRGDGSWPPGDGRPGADLGRFLGDRWRVLAARSRLLAATRNWFAHQGFIEVETPLLVPSAGTEVHIDPVTATLHPTPGAGPEARYLITSPEYAMKRLLAAGAGPIYQLGRVFRDGERGRRHRPEFTLLEWYRPWVDGYDAILDDCEQLLRSLAGTDTITWQGRAFDLTPPFPRIAFFDALRERADIAHPEDLDPERWLQAYVERVEATLGAERPEFLVRWPRALASLARGAPDDPRVAERVELYVGGLELGNGFAELTDPVEQRARCDAENDERHALGKPVMPLDEDFLGALVAGMPPSAGIAVGFDRLVMLLTDVAGIDDATAF